MRKERRKQEVRVQHEELCQSGIRQFHQRWNSTTKEESTDLGPALAVWK
jgi:hypothetical protein